MRPQGPWALHDLKLRVWAGDLLTAASHRPATCMLHTADSKSLSVSLYVRSEQKLSTVGELYLLSLPTPTGSMMQYLTVTVCALRHFCMYDWGISVTAVYINLAVLAATPADHSKIAACIRAEEACVQRTADPKVLNLY